MLINEVCKKCQLTKKAIAYYEEQGLIHPKISDNGYRIFSYDDVAYLKKVSILRSLGLSVTDIKLALEKDSFLMLRNIYDRKNWELSVIQAKQ